MKTNISEQDILGEFLKNVGGSAEISIWRGKNGYYDRAPDEFYKVNNVPLAAGLNELAAKTIVTSRPAYNYIAVGTSTVAHSLGSVWAGEVSRKIGHTVANSKMTMVLVATWGGAADSITSVALETATIVNNASSGSGIPLNVLTGVAATLGGSDILSLQMNFQIGSHNL